MVSSTVPEAGAYWQGKFAKVPLHLGDKWLGKPPTLSQNPKAILSPYTSHLITCVTSLCIPGMTLPFTSVSSRLPGTVITSFSFPIMQAGYSLLLVIIYCCARNSWPGIVTAMSSLHYEDHLTKPLISCTLCKRTLPEIQGIKLNFGQY